MPFNTLKETLEPLLPPVLMAVFGCIAKFCVGKNRSLGQLISGLVVSAFSGTIAALFLADMSLSLYAKMGLGGMAGYMGGWFLEAYARRIARAVETTAPLWDGTECRGHARQKDETGKE